MTNRAGQDEIESGFTLAERMSFQRKVTSAEFWLELNPALSISRHPFARPVPQLLLSDQIIDACQKSLCQDGYLTTESILPPELYRNFSEGVQTIVAAGYPSVFACIYDEFYQIFHAVHPIIERIFDSRALLLTEGFWTFHVSAGEVGGGIGPHRDSIGQDPYLLQRGEPSILNVWIPLTDATLENSCIYVVPATEDPEYTRLPEGHAVGTAFDLQGIRALPAPAGALQCWTSHLIHWGSRASVSSTTPRVSVACYFQRSDVPEFHSSSVQIEPDTPVPFERRLEWIAYTYDNPQVFSYSAP